MNSNHKLAGIGAEIYFDHHARDRWTFFADRMSEIGLSFARIGEFTWDRMEKDEGQFDFAWLDDIINLLAARNISVILCTPTGSPPDWLCSKYPQVVPTTVQGHSYGSGSRRHTCPTSAAYRKNCQRIVRAMARRYAKNPNIIGWQIDNEIGHPFCYCKLCHQAFQKWVQTQFSSIEEFNFNIGQFFLGRTSRSFEEIPLPGSISDSNEPSCNPCLTNLYYRFMDHQIRECWSLQIEWLRQEGVTAPITTNAMITWHGYDHEKMYANLDVAAGDCYPSSAFHKWNLYQDGRYPGFAFFSAYLRGIKHGQNIGFMEMRWGPTGGDAQYPMPGEIKYWAYACLAGGADFINYFRFDTCPSGGERGHYGLIPASGIIPRAFEEVKELCIETKRLIPELIQTHVPIAPVGILFTYATHIATYIHPEVEELSGPFGNGYGMHLACHFRSLVGQNIPTDIVYPGENFSKYRVLIVSALKVLDRALAKKIEAYVKAGGILIMAPLSGVLDENTKEWEILHPAHLDHVVGVKVESMGMLQLRKLSLNIKPTLKSKLPKLTASSVINFLQLHSSTKVLATFQGPLPYNNQPAITRSQYGKGITYYVSAFLDELSLAQLYHAILGLHDIAAEFETPADVHFAKRTGKGRDLYFLFNSSNKTANVSLPFKIHDFFTRKALKTISIGSTGYRLCYRETRSDSNGATL